MLKIVDWINFHSEKKGEFHLKSLEIFEATSDTSVEFEVAEELYEIFDTTSDVEISPEEMPAFICISRYVAKKVSQKLNCDLCTSKVITTKGLEYEIDTAFKYVSLLNRGGLKWPTKYILEILVESYQIFNKLIRKEFQEKFLKANNHKQLLEHLVSEEMEFLNAVPEVSCEYENFRIWCFLCFLLLESPPPNDGCPETFLNDVKESEHGDSKPISEQASNMTEHCSALYK
ncbi:hypothetical protein AVEN_96554-1 [Araneus ventricosus]|uniref:Uncharacterized protein n=1 Tax=Araneus ventricosus TaxID=182803 RepID=A0A4Y2H728_ARAVE|nr:hypothetical protein AVEN_96554-1 [Araneus ventricosus]